MEVDVKVISVPHFDGLRIEDMLEYAQRTENGKAMKALPVLRREIEKMPRPYIANVIYTIIGQPFKDWVEKRVN